MIFYGKTRKTSEEDRRNLSRRVILFPSALLVKVGLEVELHAQLGARHQAGCRDQIWVPRAIETYEGPDTDGQLARDVLGGLGPELHAVPGVECGEAGAASGWRRQRDTQLLARSQQRLRAQIWAGATVKKYHVKGLHTVVARDCVRCLALGLRGVHGVPPERVDHFVWWRWRAFRSRSLMGHALVERFGYLTKLIGKVSIIF